MYEQFCVQNLSTTLHAFKKSHYINVLFHAIHKKFTIYRLHTVLNYKQDY